MKSLEEDGLCGTTLLEGGVYDDVENNDVDNDDDHNDCNDNDDDGDNDLYIIGECLSRKMSTLPNGRSRTFRNLLEPSGTF